MFMLTRLSGPGAPGRLPRGPLRALAIAITVGFVGGCSGFQGAAPVEPDRAREALKTALDVWKKGDQPGALKESTPPITAQDLDWLGGAKLVNYEVTGDGKSIEANLFVPVTLTLAMPKGKEVKKKVTYVVGTSPYLTVFRSLP